MKRSIAVFLLVVLALSLPTGALASWGNPSSSGSYEVSASTTLRNSSNAKINNVELACASINGTYVTNGGSFSFNDVVGERGVANGYKSALNGRGAKVRGGGVAQVASTLFLALKQLTGIQYTDIKTYGDKFTDNYVSNPDDAIVTDYSNGTDFAFINNAGDLLISMWVSRSYCYCTITVYPGGGSGNTQTGYGTLIGYASTPVTGTNVYKNNIALASANINGQNFSYYEEFSFNAIVGPRTEKNGYGTAVNGRGYRITGGGVAQVASTVYLAIKNMSNIDITSLKTYDEKYNQNYVENGRDAVVTDYNNNTDFCFRYTGSGRLTVLTYLNASSTKLICEVYEANGWGW